MRLKKFTLGAKIRIGFSVVLLLLSILAVWSYIGTNSVVKNAEDVISGHQLDSIMAEKEIDHLNWAKQLTELLTNPDVTTLQVQTDHRECAFGKWLYGDQRLAAEKLVPSLSSLLKQVEKPHEELHKSAVDIGKIYHAVDHRLGWFLREQKSDHLTWLLHLKDGLFDSDDSLIKIESDPRRCTFGKWIYSAEAEKMVKDDEKFADVLASVRPLHKALHKSIIDVNRKLNELDRSAAIAHFKEVTQKLADQTLSAMDAIRDWHDGLIELEEDTYAIYAYETVPASAEVQSILRDIRQEAKSHILSDQGMLTAANNTKTSIVVIAVIALMLGLILAIIISRGIIRALKSISSRMEQSADQVASASQQIASSSQSLASGSSEQAASIEESSSSLEQMSSMTSQNAENAHVVNGLVKDNNQIIGQASGSMADLTDSMSGISKASEETSKIIKTIDEIAFQTNLLALNAAVEAARAGEAGAGFAIVADEVRNLAMRTADAAKNTADLIEGTVKKVKDGSDLVIKTDEAFTSVAESAARVGGLVGEIAAASNEQAQGIEQMNKAVVDMDKVTQQNVANAEESASAAEEMSAQAVKMKEVVDELVSLVDGAYQVSKRSHMLSEKTKDIGAYNVQVAANPPSKKDLSENQSGKMIPEQVIPLKDDFNNFLTDSF